MKNFIATTKAVLKRVKLHNVTVSAAGIAFYGLLALVPTLIALVSVYALLADPTQIEQQVSDAAGSLDDETKAFVTSQLQSIVGDVEENAAEGTSSSSPVGRWFALGTGIILALFSASGALQKLMGTIAVAYQAEENRPGWKVRALAYVFTAGAIVGAALLGFVIAVAPVMLNRLSLGTAGKLAIQFGQLPIIGLLFAGALTVLYRYSPDRSPKTPWRNVGAVVGTVLFVLFALGFSIYSSNVSAMPASYGLLGSVAALMIFLQLTSIAIIVGAEVNALREEQAVQEAQAIQSAPSSSMTNSSRHQDAEPLSFGKAAAAFVAITVLGGKK